MYDPEQIAEAVDLVIDAGMPNIEDAIGTIAEAYKLSRDEVAEAWDTVLT